MKIAPMRDIERSAPDPRILINAITLIALGISILVLDTWGNLFVRLVVGLFWTSFLLFLNGPGLVRALRAPKRLDARRRTNHGLATYEHRPSGY